MTLKIIFPVSFISVAKTKNPFKAAVWRSLLFAFLHFPPILLVTSENKSLWHTTYDIMKKFTLCYSSTRLKVFLCSTISCRIHFRCLIIIDIMYSVFVSEIYRFREKEKIRIHLTGSQHLAKHIHTRTHCLS